MLETFGGITIVNTRQDFEGAIIEFDNSDENLYVKSMQKKRNYYGEVYDVVEEESYKIGKASDFFYDKDKTLRDPDEIISRIVHTIIYEIGFYPDENDFSVDESIPHYYEQCNR